MVINHLEKLFVTSDAATILREMEVVHPAAKMMVMAAQQQEREVGDGSNLVVVLIGELLSQAEALIKSGVHTSEVIAGYTIAYKKALELLPTLVVSPPTRIDVHDRASLEIGILSAIASKQYGVEKTLTFLVAHAASLVMPRNPANFVVESVRVCKILGQSINESYVVKGVVIDRDAEGTIKHSVAGKVAVFSCPLDATSTDTKGTVLISSAQELLNYSASEESSMETHIKELADLGVTVCIVSGAISQIALHFLEKYRIMTLKVMSKFELRRIARCVGARLIPQLGGYKLEEMGSCASVDVEEVGSHKITVIKQNLEDTGIATIVIRGSTQNILNDIERAIDDGVNVVRALARDSRLLAGAGAVEIELARLIQKFGEHSAGLDQYAIRKFGEAFEIVPRTLAENAGLNPTDIIAKLYAAHEKGEIAVGVDIEENGVRDLTANGVYDALLTKEQAILLAADTAITILRVDQIIMSKPAGGPKPPQQQGNWDDQDE